MKINKQNYMRGFQDMLDKSLVEFYLSKRQVCSCCNAYLLGLAGLLDSQINFGG